MTSILLVVLIIVAFITDARKSLIPNKLTVSAAAAGLITHGWMDGWSGLIYSTAGLGIGFMVLLLLYAFGALGAGDVKLFAAVGAITGVTFVLSSMMYSVLYAGVIGLLLLVVKGKVQRTIKKLFYVLISILAFKDLASVGHFNKDEPIRFPFMYAVVPGVMTAWLYAGV